MTWSKASRIEGEIAFAFLESSKDEIEFRVLNEFVNKSIPAVSASVRMVLDESPLFLRVGPTTWTTANRYGVNA